MTRTLLSLLLAASLLVGAMPSWSGAAATAGPGDGGPGLVAGGARDGSALSAGYLPQSERPAKKGAPASADVEPPPATGERSVAAWRAGGPGPSVPAPAPHDRPFARPEARAPPA